MSKERPILFSGEMVRAVMDDRKSQTRRVMKHQPEMVCGNPDQKLDAGWWNAKNQFWMKRSTVANFESPYGTVGDRLWIKETFRFPKDLDKYSPSQVAEKALDAGYRKPWAPIKYEADGATVFPIPLKDFGGEWGKSRVSIHMPRWASRITLEITGIRVERLQDISESDAIAEGIELGGFATRRAVPFFRELWESINGPGSWDQNPWVWVIEFSRKETTDATV